MSRAYILGELDLELAKAREKFAAFAREVQQNPLKVGVDIARKGDRSTLAGQTIDGPDAELSPSSPAAGGRRLDAQEALQQRWLYTAPASSLGGSTGGPTGFIPATASTNSVYGSVGYARAAGPFGSTQQLPNQASDVDRARILSEIRRRAADADLADADRSLSGVNIKNALPPAVGGKFYAHGVAGGLDSLDNLLRNGIDRSKQFFSDKLTNGTGLLRDNASFVTYGHPGRPIEEGIRGVIVDKLHAPDIDKFRKLYPGVEFVSRDNAAAHLATVAQGGQRAAPPTATAMATPVPVPADVVGQAQARSRAAQWQDDQDRRVAAVRYGQFERGARDAGFVGPLISPRDFASPGGRAEALDEVARARGMRASPAAVNPLYGDSRQTSPSTSLLTAIAPYATAATAALSVIDREVGLRQQTRDRNRFDTLDDAAEEAYATARNTSGLTRSIGGAANFLRSLTGDDRKFIDDQTVSDTRDDRDRQRATRRDAELLRENRLGERANALIGSTGFASEIGNAAIGAERAILTNNDEARNNRFIGNLTQANNVIRQGLQDTIADAQVRIGQVAQQMAGQATVSSLSGSNDTFNAGRLSLELQQQQRGFDLSRSLRGVSGPEATRLREAEGAAVVAENRAFREQYNRQASIASGQQVTGAGASVLSQRGFSLRGAQFENAESLRTTLAGLPGYSTYQADPNSVNAADRNRIESTIAAAQVRDRGIQQNYLRGVVAQQGAISATNLAADYQPFQAERERIQSGFASQSLGMSRGSEERRRLADQASADLRLLNSRESAFALDTGIGLAAERRAIELSQQPYINPLAVDVNAIAGSTVSDAVSLFRQGDAGRSLARERIENGRLAVEGRIREFSNTFEGRSFDAINLVGRSRQDFFDPKTGFEEAERALSQLSRLGAASNAEFLGVAGAASGADEIKGAIIEAIKEAVPAAVEATLGRVAGSTGGAG